MLPGAMSEFFQRNHVMCLATASGGQPYSTPLFYYFSASDVVFSFLSSLQTRHADEAIRNESVSAAVYAPHRDVAMLQGAQMLGTVSMHSAEDSKSSRDFAAYRERFPECEPLLGDPELRFWTLRVHWIKYTDNTVRFGHKEIWSRS